MFTFYVGHIPTEDTSAFNAVSYIRQLFMVQLWFQPFFDGSSWDGPAWSISAEWLAYLLFGVLIAVIFRLAQVTRARGLMLLAPGGVAAARPPAADQRALLHPWSWLPRILMQFTAGSAGLRRGPPAAPVPPDARAGGVAAAAIVARVREPPLCSWTPTRCTM